MRRFAECLIAAAVVLVAAPSFAQSRSVALRPFLLAADEHFAARTTFNTLFDSSTSPFWGGGLDVVFHERIFLDVAVSHMAMSGQRAFVSNGDVFPLGIPLRLTSTPVEVSAGYRFHLGKSRLTPYIGAGIGSYSFHETSDFSVPADDVDVRHSGFVAMAGAELRASRWLRVTGDAQYTRVPGILGDGGVSKDANERDFGGVAARLRMLVGR